MPKISNLPAAASSVLTDIFPAVQGGITKKETLQQVLTLFNANIVIAESQVTGLVADLASKLNLSGGTMTGAINMGGFAITNLLDPASAQDAATRAYVLSFFPVSLANGGTNAALVAANGAVPYSTATAIALLAPGSTGQLFRSGGAGAPTWTTATFPATAGALGNVLKSDGTNWVSAADTPGALTDAHIYVGDVSNVAQDVAVSGDATMANTGALSVVSVTGTATNDNAAAGKVGEFISSTIAVGSAVSLSNATPANVTSISLTAGDWDVWGDVGASNTTNQMGLMSCWTSSTSATQPDGSLVCGFYNVAQGDTEFHINTPYRRYSLSGTTTVYLSVVANFAGGTTTGFGGIYARRAR